MNILLADDDEDTRYLLTTFLHDRGHDVTVVRDGSELLAVVENGPGSIDIIVTDNDMPDGPNGIEVLRWLRRDSRFSSVPVIVHSASQLAATVASYGGLYAEKDGAYRNLFEAITACQTVLHYRSHP